MADRNPLWVSHTPGGVVTIDDARIGVSALWTPGSSAVNARKGLRPSGSTAVTTPGFVAQQTVADKTVKVNAYQAVIPASRATGSFICTLDATKNIDLLTLHPAHASLQRNDLIVGQVSDETVDSANGFSTFQVVGTPSGSPVDPAVNITNGAPTNSPDYVVLARVRVTANATTITTSMIDDLRPPWLVAAGGVLPILNSTDRATLTPYDGMAIWRIDRKWIEVYSIAAGGWLVQGVAIGSSLADIQSAVTTPQAGQMAATTAGVTYVYVGSAWVGADSTAIGGKRYITGGNLATTSGTTETLAGVDTGSLSLDANSTYEVTALLNYNVSNTGDAFNFIVRATNISGAIQQQQIYNNNPGGVPLAARVSFTVKTSTAVSVTYVATVQRNSGTGTATVTASATGGTYMIATKLGQSTTITDV